MDAFTLMTHAWANFFSALAQVSGALVGLIFVALTFKPKTLVRGGDPLMGALASQTFADFVLLLLISMVMLAPQMPASNVGAIFLLIVVIDLARMLRSLFSLRTHLGRLRIMHRFVLSVLGHLMLGGTGVELMRGASGTDIVGSLLLSGVVMLLLSGCRSAWLLVVHEGVPIPGEREKPLDPGLHRDGGQD